MPVDDQSKKLFRTLMIFRVTLSIFSNYEYYRKVCIWFIYIKTINYFVSYEPMDGGKNAKKANCKAKRQSVNNERNRLE